MAGQREVSTKEAAFINEWDRYAGESPQKSFIGSIVKGLHKTEYKKKKKKERVNSSGPSAWDKFKSFLHNLIKPENSIRRGVSNYKRGK